MLPPLPAWPGRPVEIAYVVMAGLATVEASVRGPSVQRVPVRLALDSGCSFLALDDGLEETVDAPAVSGPIVVRGLRREDGGVGRPVRRVRALPDLAIAQGVTIRRVPLIHAPLPRPALDAGIVGFLGLNIFWGRALLFDIPRRRALVLRDEDVALLVSGSCVVVPARFQPDGALPRVDVTFRVPGAIEPVKLEADTGAARSSIEADVDLRIGGRVKVEQRDFTMPVRLGPIEIGHRFHAVEAGSEPPRLAFDFFQALGRPVLFDPARSRIVFLPAAGP
jgi:hypothetical protein